MGGGEHIQLYSTAALFNGRELAFNSTLNDILENRYGYKTYVPQRDGFEFEHMEPLAQHLKARGLCDVEVTTATSTIIYALDMGYFIRKSHAVVVCLDEPVDEGCMAELTHAHMLGKPVVGWRTEERTPFGARQDRLQGCHFFPPYLCDEFVIHRFPARDVAQSKDSLEKLAANIHHALQRPRVREQFRKDPVNHATPAAERIFNTAHLLFDRIENLHALEAVKTIADRYVDHVLPMQSDPGRAITCEVIVNPDPQI